MGDYLYNGASLSSTTETATKEIAKTSCTKTDTKLSEKILISKDIISDDANATYYKNDAFSGCYITKNTNILSGKWGDIAHTAASYYKYKGNNVPFVKAISCPMFYDVSTADWRTPKYWGDILKEGPATVLLASTKNNSGSGDVGIWYSADNGSTWQKKKVGHSLCFIDLVAGGGGGDSATLGTLDVAGGGGGGGGSYIRAALDLTKTGLVTIKIGAGGAGGTSTTYPTGTSDGENSTLTSTSELSITCGGGKCGHFDNNYAAVGGDGGTVSGTTSIDVDRGLLGISTQPGKAGGNGASIYINGYNTKINSNATNSSYFSTETYTSFGLLKSNAKIYDSTYRGYAGSLYERYTSASGYQYTFGNITLPNGLAGGGGGPSALGGGRVAGSSLGGTGYGYGGAGAACGKKTSSTTYSNTNGTDGGVGVLIIHGTDDSDDNFMSLNRLDI